MGAQGMLTSPELIWLLAAVAKGDAAAFERVYQATAAKLYGVVLRIVRRADVAHEVAVETYLQVWRTAGAFDPAAASPLTWMLAIARSRALDLVRANPENFTDEDATIAVPAAADPSARQMGDELKRLLGCMGRLDEERRRLVLTAYYSGRSRDELAAEFHQPVAAIRSGLRRTLFDIEACLKASPDSRDEPRDQPDDLSLALSDDMLAAEYVLGTLGADERKDAQDRIASDSAFAALIGRWERRLGELHVLTADMEPPPAVWDAIKEKLAETAPSETVRLPDPTPPPAPPPPPVAPNIRALRARAARWRTLAFFTGSLAAALLAFILLPRWAPGLLPPSLSPKPAAPAAKSADPGAPSRYVAVLERDAVPPAFVLLVDAAAHSLTLRRLGAPRELGKSYELWLISGRLPAPRSLGLVGPGDVTEFSDVLADDDPALIGAASFAVSLEPDGGSPTGAPSNVAFSGKPMAANTAVTPEPEAK
jgi:RNA polymerase sigma factor (sigma-70 family)